MTSRRSKPLSRRRKSVMAHERRMPISEARVSRPSNQGAAVARTGLVPNAESYGAMGRAAPPTALPAPVRDWLAAEHGVINAAW